MINHSNISCDACFYYELSRNRCNNPRSINFGNDITGTMPCNYYASRKAALHAIPRRKKWRKVKSIYDAELPNARFI